jgi:type I restriction enzyme R subunit
MNTQPEQILENNLVTQLQSLGYEKVVIRDERELVSFTAIDKEYDKGVIF